MKTSQKGVAISQEARNHKKLEEVKKVFSPRVPEGA